MLCPKCQGWVSPGTRTCPACGKDLFGPPPETQTPAASPSAPEDTATDSPPAPPQVPPPHSQSPGGPGLLGSGPFAGSGASAHGLAPNVASGLSYLLGFISGIVFLIIEKKDRQVRFAAWQSIVFSGFWLLFRIVLGVLLSILIGLTELLARAQVYALYPLFELFYLIAAIINLAFLVVWFVVMVKAFSGKTVRLPVLAHWADRLNTGR